MNNQSVFDKHIIAFFSSALQRTLIARGGGLGMKGLFRRLRILSETLAFQREQAKKRELAAACGKSVPPVLIASITRRCNLNCKGCYSKTLRRGPSGELKDETFLKIFKEASDLGVGTILIAGGEPLMRPELLKAAADIPGVIMPVFTNGLLMDDEFLDLFSSGRLIPIFSLEGEAGFTADRRGRGIHENVLTKAEQLRKRGALFGLSVTLTSQNADFVLSEAFFNECRTLGTSVLFLVEYVPVAPGTEHLVLTDVQKQALKDINSIAGRGLNVISLPGDEEQYGGCLAAGRGFIHISDEGRVEACPFAPFSDSNAGETGLPAALDSPLMKAIRARHVELTETKGGCALWNKKGWVTNLSACAGAVAEAGKTVVA